MGTNGKTEATDLVKRCEAVGWQVVRGGSGHFKVDTRKGTFMIPSTPGDVRSAKNALAEARRYGLDRLEAAIQEREDRERLSRLKDDRDANDAKLAKIQVANDVASAEVSSTTTTSSADLGSVDGVAIAAIAPAKYKTPRGHKLAVLTDGEELLLVNDEVLYRCLREIKPGERCHLTFPSGNSLQVHISRHTRNVESEEKVRTVVVENQPVVAAIVGKRTSTESTEQLKIQLTAGMTALLNAIERIGASSVEVRNALLKMIEQVQHLKVEVTEPDPELVAKARQFDALAATLGSLINPSK